MKDEIKNFFLSQINEHELVIEKTKLSVERNFLNLVNICVKSVKNGKKIIFFGNGGSASDAQHLSTELTVRFCENRKSIPAISLVTDTSAISAIGNDYGFKYIFSRQLEAIGNKGDICIFLTTSGESQNILEAAKIAKKKLISCYSFSGKGGGKLKKIIKNNIIINSNLTSVIQS